MRGHRFAPQHRPEVLHSMRILHVLHNSVPLLCGYSIRSGYIVNLQRAMGLHPSGRQLRAAPERPRDARDHRRRRVPANCRGARSIPCPFSASGMLMRNLERQVESAAREMRPDIIHAHSPVLVGLPALRVARRLGLGFVYEIRDLWENASVDRGRFGAGSPMYRIARKLDSHVLSRADAVVTICDLLKAELRPASAGPKTCTSSRTASTRRHLRRRRRIIH